MNGLGRREFRAQASFSIGDPGEQQKKLQTK
jgi:hypothetical protein